jgi:hypothetical protein
MPVLLLGGGLAVGLLAQLGSALGADSQDVLFSGQASLPAVLAGPAFPAILLGVALMTLGVIWFDISPVIAVAAGTAAGMAAMTRMLLTPMLIAACS